jgi:hypothetical protein
MAPIAIPAASRTDDNGASSDSAHRNLALVSRIRRRPANDHESLEERKPAEPVVKESVRVISRTPRFEPVVEPAPPPPLSPAPFSQLAPPWPPSRGLAAQPAPDWRHGPVGAIPDAGRDQGMGSAARRTAFMVGSRAREALLGYPFPTAEARAPAPFSGAEPPTGQTVVLVGDDVEAWVRERRYGGHLPDR